MELHTCRGRFVCPVGPHVPDYVTVTVDEFLDPDGIGVLVEGEGGVTNRWADGVAGLSNEIREAADAESEGMCNEHREPTTWTNDCGDFPATA